MEAQSQQQSTPPKAGKPSPPSPPPLSPIASPSHEFSFTISLHPPPDYSPPPPFKFTTTTTTTKLATTTTTTTNDTSTPDLAPADDIFFHGHLLPLQFLSHSSISPRPSDITIEDLSFPLDQIPDHQPNTAKAQRTTTAATATTKPRSFFLGLANWWKGAGEPAQKEDDRKRRRRRRMAFDIGRILKKYMSLVEPLFSSRGERERRDLRRRPYSFSGHSNPRMRGGPARRRREASAPASMRTSPTNSGLLLATAPNAAFSSSDESTMEELQSAIQAAIAHCKSSTAAGKGQQVT